jgi:hypothetical protein
MQFEVECDPKRYENKIEPIEGIHSLNLFGENNLFGVQKPFVNRWGMCWNVSLKESK